MLRRRTSIDLSTPKRVAYTMLCMALGAFLSTILTSFIERGHTEQRVVGANLIGPYEGYFITGSPVIPHQHEDRP